MAGAVPSLVGVVPGQRASFVRASSREGVRNTTFVFEHGNVLLTDFKYATLTRHNIVEGADARLRLSTLIETFDEGRRGS